MTVLVTRDEFPPNFISTPYTATITENAVINSTVLTVAATDQDLEVRCLLGCFRGALLSWWICRNVVSETRTRTIALVAG